MSSVRYYNRYTQQIEEEAIYGEAYLRWAYENPLGRLSLHLLVKRPLFSKWYGWRMSRSASKRLIEPFIRGYGLDVGEFKKSVSCFASFNEFFYRELKPEARPLDGDSNSILFPADGRHMAIARLGSERNIYIKGQRLNLSRLFGDESLAKRFEGGSALISRLCPVDYHRFHSPVAGRISRQHLINGPLFSVSPVALMGNLAYLWENKRMLALIETERLGCVAFVAIGATCVGSIQMTKGQGEEVARGEELGYFAFGGSCVISLFQPGRMNLSEDLASQAKASREMYAKVGDAAGLAGS